MCSFLLFALNFSAQLHKDLLCPGIPEFGKEVLSSLYPVSALPSVTSASQGDKLLVKQPGLKSKPPRYVF